MSAVILKLTRLIWPDNPAEKLFRVKVEDTEDVLDLKNLIKLACARRFSGINVADLVLWKCANLPGDDDGLQEALDAIRFDGSDTRLFRLGRARQCLREYFGGDNLSVEPIHILVQAPDYDQSGTRRAQFTQANPSAASSSKVGVRDFREHKANPERSLHRNRPCVDVVMADVKVEEKADENLAAEDPTQPRAAQTVAELHNSRRRTEDQVASQSSGQLEELRSEAMPRSSAQSKQLTFNAPKKSLKSRYGSTALPHSLDVKPGNRVTRSQSADEALGNFNHYISTINLKGPCHYRAAEAVSGSNNLVQPGKYYAGQHNVTGKWLIGAAVEIRGLAANNQAAKKTKKISRANSKDGWVCLLLFKGRHRVQHQRTLSKVIKGLSITPIPDIDGQEVFATMFWEWVRLDTIRGPLNNIHLKTPADAGEDVPDGSLFCRYVVNDGRTGVEMWSALLPSGCPAWPSQIRDEECSKLSDWVSPNRVASSVRRVSDTDSDFHPETPSIVLDTLKAENVKEVWGATEPEGMRAGETYDYDTWIPGLDGDDDDEAEV